MDDRHVPVGGLQNAVTPMMMSVIQATESRRHGDRALTSPHLRVPVALFGVLFGIVMSVPVTRARPWRRGGAGGQSASGRADRLTGYWVSPIIETGNTG